MKKIFLFVIVAILVSVSIFAVSVNISNANILTANSASWANAITTFIGRTVDTIGSRISDIVYFLSMQKKYIFDGYKDPNAYSDFSVPTSFETTVDNLKKRTAEAFSGVSTTSGGTIKKPLTVGVKAGTGTALSGSKTVSSGVGSLIKTEPLLPDISKIVLDKTSPTVVNSGTGVSGTWTFESNNTVNGTQAGGGQILPLTNSERAKNGVSQLLVANSLLNTIAKMRMDDMFAKQYFQHSSPTGGDTASIYAKQVGYEYILIGENIALGNFSSDKEMVEAWMNSPGHRANILNKNYTMLGVAVGSGTYENRTQTIGVQIFGRPLSLCPKPDQTNQDLIASSTESIKQAQIKAETMLAELNQVKAAANVDWSYFNQKVIEYNYFAKQINESVAALKVLIEKYNSEVKIFNSCISLN